MNNAYGVTVDNLLSTFPFALRNDPSLYAMATAVATVLAKRPEEIERVLIYPAIDKLPEDLLDILAYDLTVDWYDFDAPIDRKRDLIKTSFYVHRHLGTKGAVSAALSAMYPGTTVKEWFEYDGEPFHFRILSTNPQITDKTVSELYQILAIVKRLSAWLDEIVLDVEVPPTELEIGTFLGRGYESTTLPEYDPGYEFDRMLPVDMDYLGTYMRTTLSEMEFVFREVENLGAAVSSSNVTIDLTEQEGQE